MSDILSHGIDYTRQPTASFQRQQQPEQQQQNQPQLLQRRHSSNVSDQPIAFASLSHWPITVELEAQHNMPGYVNQSSSFEQLQGPFVDPQPSPPWPNYGSVDMENMDPNNSFQSRCTLDANQDRNMISFSPSIHVQAPEDDSPSLLYSSASDPWI